MRKLGEFLVHSPTNISDRVLFISLSHFFVHGSGERVSKSCQYPQKCFGHFQHKILLLQTILLLNQAVVDEIGINPYLLKYMERDWHTNSPATKIISVISNKMV